MRREARTWGLLKRIRLKHVSEFKYLECVLDESGTYETECSRKARSRIRAVQMENLRGLLGIKRMD